MDDGPCMNIALELEEATKHWIEAAEKLKQLQALEPSGDLEKRLKLQDELAEAKRLEEITHKTFNDKNDALKKCREENDLP